MAVDLIQLAAALRLGDGENAPTEPVAGILSRLLGVSQAFVQIAAPEAPEAIADEATTRMSAYLFDAPTAASGDRYAAAWRNSGAENLVSRFVVRRAGSEGEGVPDAGTSTGGLDDAQVRAIVGSLLGEHADIDNVHHTPPEGGGGDVTAHNAANDAHEDIREAVGDRVTQDTVEETAQRLIDGAGHASNVDLGRAGERIDTNRDNLTEHEATPHGGDGGTDQAARDAAAAAQADIDDHEANHPGGQGSGDDAYPWATEGNDDLLVPTDKINFAPVQNQIDEIVDQIAHSEGTINSVVGILGAGSDSLRYTLPVDLDGLYDVSVRVKVRVQINEFQNISGNLHIIADGGLGLNTEIPESVHNYHHAHEGVFNFLRKGLAIAPGASQINFTALVTGVSPPDVHFIDVMNMTITSTPATPTPPTVLVDGAAYTAHGDVTVAGWRDHDFVQLFYAVGGNTYMTPPVNTVQLIAFTSLIVPIGRNVEWTLSIDAADDDVINTAQSSGGNAVAAPTATSTITVIAWRAG